MGRGQDVTSAASPEPCAALFQSGHCRHGACERQPPRTFSLSSLKSNEGGQTHNHVNNNTWRSPIRGEERTPCVPGRAEAASQAEAGDAPGHTQPETGSAGLCIDPNVQRSISDIPEIAKNDREAAPSPRWARRSSQLSPVASPSVWPLPFAGGSECPSFRAELLPTPKAGCLAGSRRPERGGDWYPGLRCLSRPVGTGRPPPFGSYGSVSCRAERTVRQQRQWRKLEWSVHVLPQ